MSVTREMERQQAKDQVVEAAVEAAEERIRFNAVVRQRGTPPAARPTGEYNDDDEWVEYWKAGMPVASRPIRPTS